MKPTQTWKANKWRSDLRKYTREFQSNFESRTPLQILPGTVYASRYRGDSTFPTDKHHITPLFVSFGRYKDDEGKVHVRGINLLYLRKDQQLEILDEIYAHFSKKPDERVAPIIKVHEKWMKISPYAFKNYEERRMIAIREISSLDWGMIPLLQTHLLGNFNAQALNEDFQKESKAPRKTKYKKSSPPAEKAEETEVVSEMIEGDFPDIDFEDE